MKKYNFIFLNGCWYLRRSYVSYTDCPLILGTAPTSTCTENCWPKNWMTLSWTPDSRHCLRTCKLSCWPRSMVGTIQAWTPWPDWASEPPAYGSLVCPTMAIPLWATNTLTILYTKNLKAATPMASCRASQMITWCWTWAPHPVFNLAAASTPHMSQKRAAMKASY